MSKKIIEFIKQRDFELIKELGNGAFGKTYLLQDNDIGHEFVCKKYSPLKGIEKEEYFKNFINEIKLLHLLYHKNIVRVFNYYLYPDNYVGYIMMEHIEGSDILSYLKKYPEDINSIFEQTINGFIYLEKNKILHRDIRNLNIMVDNNSNVKIIDFGFGKEIKFEEDNNKSISINWIGNQIPSEFKEHKYDHKTEIFFIGKLFEDILHHIDASFKYKSILKSMIKIDYIDRINSFEEVKNKMLDTNDITKLFSHDEKLIYQELADLITNNLSSIKSSSILKMDIDDIIQNLEELNKKTMLEDYVNVKHLLRVFIEGNYTYRNRNSSTDIIHQFTNFFINISKEKQNLVMYNLNTRFLDIDIEYDNVSDEIPF
ncbi:hypothetical protein ALC152_02070 [Arcobacter sp. 15-2]|uniref:protein kinase domain-containing protein n=1 Tax=Arcobacter sp. 15-2 TaxID=3374109 RepID=UPI00399C5882